MIDIFICEDSYKQLNIIDSYIQNYLMIEHLDMMRVALATSNPYDILNYLENNNVDKGLYFFDIALETDINGIELASKIKKQKVNSKIVFITTHSEMVFLTFRYQIEAMDYILKDNPDDLQSRIIEDIKLCNQEFQRNDSESDEYYQFKTGEHLRSVKIADILFFESSPVPHKVTVHLINGQFEFYSTIKDIENENKVFLDVTSRMLSMLII